MEQSYVYEYGFFWHKLKNQLQKEPKLQRTQAN